MKKMIRIGALLLSTILIASSSMTAFAKEKSYTYNYDYWEDVQDSADFYTVVGTYTAVDLGIEGKLLKPEGLFVSDQDVYICDTGNNRIIQLTRTSKEKFELVRIFDSFKGNVEVTTFNSPTDIAVAENGDLYIADKNNSRILKLDKDLNYITEFVKPNDSTLEADSGFFPNKISIDTAGRVYCIAVGINKGLIKYENDTTFSGFVGATKVTYDWTDYLQKKFATQEQRALMVNFVPTEYSNIYMDYEGFVYATCSSLEEEALRNETGNAVRRLNLLGTDILVRNGNYPVYGDLYWGSGGGYEGPSQFADVTALDNDTYICLDKNRGRLFGYNDQGHLMFAFGGNGNMDGYFRQASAIEHMGNDLIVLDQLDCSITLFTTTEFGGLVYDAMYEFNQGNYDVSGNLWQEVMNLNGNYDLAYIGIGRSLLRQEEYKEAMEYFELKYDDENYSKAYKQYRKEWVEEHIVQIIIVLLALVLIPRSIGKVKSIRHEIDIADIFRN